MITGEGGEISQFVVELHGTDDYVEYRYGYPEPGPEEDITVPKDAEQARREGYIAWWKRPSWLMRLTTS